MAMELVIGIDFGTTSVRVGIFDLHGNEIIFRDQPYELITPKQGYAEQRPAEWWSSLCVAARAAIHDSKINPADIIGIGTDTTACTLVFLDKHMNPLMNAIMWMDVRSTEQAKRISKSGHPVLKLNGFSNVSPEWMPCKALWVKEVLPDIYHKAELMLECEDWLNYRLTGEIASNLNTAAARWYYDNRNGGWQHDFFEVIGLGDVGSKIPRNVVKMGDNLGTLTKQAARDLGLVAGIPVAQGGADAYVAMPALGVVREGKAALVTGSSHLLLFLSEKDIHAEGIFGSYSDAVIEGFGLVEAGQASTGSVLNWYKNNFCEHMGYDALNHEAANLPIGSDGLVCLDYFQGNRTPYTDGDVRGMISGLSLMHTPAHIYKALMESICYGTEVIFRNFEKNDVRPKELYICGGAVKSDLWLQTHSNVSNVPINVPKVSEAPALGSAILAAVAGGVYKDIVTASDNMVSFVKRIEPDQSIYEEYKFYVDRYAELYPFLSKWMHRGVKHERAKLNKDGKVLS